MNVGKGQDTHYTGDPLAVHTPSMETSVPGKKNQSRRSIFWVKFGGKICIPSQTNPATSGMNQYERPNILPACEGGRRSSLGDAQSIPALLCLWCRQGARATSSKHARREFVARASSKTQTARDQDGAIILQKKTVSKRRRRRW